LDYTVFSLGTILIILTAISFGSFLKGMTGLGLPLFAIPALSMVIPVEDAVIIMLIPGIGSNLWLVISHREHRALIQDHKIFLILGFIGALLGTWLLQNLPEAILKSLLAIGLGLYLLRRVANFDLFNRIIAKKKITSENNSSNPWSFLGIIAGVLQGASGMSAQVIAPYYHALGLSKAPYAFIVASSFLFFAVAQFTAMTGLELMNQERFTISLLALIPTLIFTRIGIHQAHRISIQGFDRVLLIMFFAMEIGLIIDIFTS